MNLYTYPTSHPQVGWGRSQAKSMTWRPLLLALLFALAMTGSGANLALAADPPICVYSHPGVDGFLFSHVDGLSATPTCNSVAIASFTYEITSGGALFPGITFAPATGAFEGKLESATYERAVVTVRVSALTAEGAVLEAIELNLLTPATCDPGYYCSNTPASAMKCPLGSYCADVAAPVLCTKGSFCPEGSAYNTPCPAGFYCQSPTVQTRCQVRGSYCPAGSFEQGTCPPGSFCPSSSVLKECTLGSYCPAATVEDQSCPAGYYCSSDTKTIQPCPRGFRCPARSISPVICTVQPGFYCPAATGDYVSCPEGFFCPNSTDEPRPCSPGYSCPFGSTAQRPCRGGFYCPKSGAEVVCPSGYYCPNGSSEPVVCGRGYYCQRQSAGPSRCTSGYIAPSETTDVCTPCEPGMFEESRLKCSPCPFGSYTSSSRSSSCNTCASGETTVPFGGTSSRQCVPASPFNGSSAVLLLTIILPIGLIGLPLFLICAYNICSKRSWIEYDGYGIAYQVKDILSLDIGGVDSAERAGFLQFIDSIVLTMNIKLANNGSSHANGILSPNVKDISSASAYMTISEMPSYQRQVYAHAIAESMSARCIKGRCCGRTSGRGDSNLILPRTLSVSGYFVFSKYQFMYRVWQDNVDAIAADAVQRLDSARGLVNDGGDNDAVPAVVVNTSNATGASTSTASSSIVSPGRAEVGKLPLLGSDAGYSGYSGV